MCGVLISPLKFMTAKLKKTWNENCKYQRDWYKSYRKMSFRKTEWLIFHIQFNLPRNIKLIKIHFSWNWLGKMEKFKLKWIMSGYFKIPIWVNKTDLGESLVRKILPNELTNHVFENRRETFNFHWRSFHDKMFASLNSS